MPKEYTQAQTIHSAMQRGADAWDRLRNDQMMSRDRHKWLNASEAASCVRRQWYTKRDQKKGIDHPAGGMARRGHIVEAHVVEILRLANVPLEVAGEDQVSLRDHERHISGTPDGKIVWDTDNQWGVDIKSFDPRTNLSKLPRKGHITQLQINLELMSTAMLPSQPRGGLLIYVNASDLDDIHIFEIDRNPVIMEWAEKRARKVLRTRAVSSLDREGKASDECRYCPFKAECLKADAVEVSEARVASGKVNRANRGSALSDAVNAYAEAKAAEEHAKAIKDKNKPIILKELKDRKQTELPVGDYVVKVEAVAGRTTLDKKKVAAAGIDLSPYEKTGAPSTRLTVEKQG